MEWLFEFSPAFFSPAHVDQDAEDGDEHVLQHDALRDGRALDAQQRGKETDPESEQEIGRDQNDRSLPQRMPEDSANHGLSPTRQELHDGFQLRCRESRSEVGWHHTRERLEPGGQLRGRIEDASSNPSGVDAGSNTIEGRPNLGPLAVEDMAGDAGVLLEQLLGVHGGAESAPVARDGYRPASGAKSVE